MKALSLLAFGAALGLTSVAFADFFEDFDTDTSASWIKLVSSGQPENQDATFAWDYFNDFQQVNYTFDGISWIPGPPQTFPGFGIPSAPGSTGGTTRGLRMRTNTFAGILSGFSASPIGESFLSDFVLTADVWINFQGPAPVGGQGSAQFPGIGFGTAGLNHQTIFNNAGLRDSVLFGCITDGTSSVDYRVYADDSRLTFANGGYYADGGATANVVSGTYAAGDQPFNTRTEDPYYQANFPATPIPAAQQIAYPASQTGSARQGSLAFAWRKWKLERTGNILKWSVDNVLMATVDLSFCDIAAEPNLLLSMSDSGGATSANSDPSGLNSTIIDNLRVVSAAPNQVVSGTLDLGDTMGSFAHPRNISYEVMQGTTAISSGSVVANASSTGFSISVPAAATGAATIVWEGSSFLKRNTAVSLTGSNQAVGSVLMQNGDVNDSGEVDAVDIDDVVANFGFLGDDPTDVDVNGEVDAVDIDIVIANFGGLDD